METKILPRLSDDLTERLNQFIYENFYTEKEKTPEGQSRLKERFFSIPKAWLLVFEESQIIGSIFLHRRRVPFNKKNIILGGIGSVCTRRDKRRQGIATMMLDEAVKILKKWECDIAYLCADIEEAGALYGQFGFVPLNKPYTYYGRSGKLYEKQNGMIASINSTKIFKEALSSKQKFHIGNSNW